MLGACVGAAGTNECMVAKLLLVHSPLVGCATWELVAADLAGRGHEVGIPDLTGTVIAGPPYCLRQAEVIAHSASGQPVILIGHSGAGPLLAAAGSLIGQVRGYLFVDAGLPIPGQAWMDTVPADLAAQVRQMADAQGWLPPWPRWWGDEVLAELLPDPEARRHFTAGCPRLPLGDGCRLAGVAGTSPAASADAADGGLRRPRRAVAAATRAQIAPAPTAT